MEAAPEHLGVRTQSLLVAAVAVEASKLKDLPEEPL
jgi:hypothetical protein